MMLSIDKRAQVPASVPPTVTMAGDDDHHCLPLLPILASLCLLVDMELTDATVVVAKYVVDIYGK